MAKSAGESINNAGSVVVVDVVEVSCPTTTGEVDDNKEADEATSNTV